MTASRDIAMQNTIISEFLRMYDRGSAWDNRSAVWPNLSREPYWQRDLIAARLMPVIGESEIFVPRRMLSEELYRFLSASGFAKPKHAILYDDEGDRLRVLASRAASSELVAIQMPLPYQDVPSSVYAIDRDLLLYLNNKSNLPYLIPSDIAAPRVKTTPDAVRAGRYEPLSWPVVVKAGLGQPSMGGDDVFVCHSMEELARAAHILPMDARVIVEPWLEHKRNICVQFLVGEFSIRYLGSAEQIIENGTAHIGNVIRSDEVISEKVNQSLRIACGRAQMLGYRGVAGFDVLVANDENAWVIDANFRLNGSTIALLLASNGTSSRATDLVSHEIDRGDDSAVQALLTACEREEIRVLATSIDDTRNRIKPTMLRKQSNDVQALLVA
jgi:hypothetical protein